MSNVERLTKVIQLAESLQLEAAEVLKSIAEKPLLDVDETLYDKLWANDRIPVIPQSDGLYVQVKGFNYASKEVLFAYATQPGNTLNNGNVSPKCWAQLQELVLEANCRSAELWCLVRAGKVNYKWFWHEVICVADGNRMRGAAKRQHAADPVRVRQRYT